MLSRRWSILPAPFESAWPPLHFSAAFESCRSAGLVLSPGDLCSTSPPQPTQPGDATSQIWSSKHCHCKISLRFVYPVWFRPAKCSDRKCSGTKCFIQLLKESWEGLAVTLQNDRGKYLHTPPFPLPISVLYSVSENYSLRFVLIPSQAVFFPEKYNISFHILHDYCGCDFFLLFLVAGFSSSPCKEQASEEHEGKAGIIPGTSSLHLPQNNKSVLC